MKKVGIGAGALIGGLLTAPMMVLMYLGDQLAGLPFVPFSVFNWMVRVLPGNLITFGIDMMIDSMLMLGMDVANTAKTAERGIAVIQFLVIGVVLGAVFVAVIRARKTKPDFFFGLVFGAFFGLPMIAIGIAMEQSIISGHIIILWLAILFLGWGVALSWAYRRLLPVGMAREPGGEVHIDEVCAAERISRRQFLITLGASAATVTVVGSGVGAVLARSAQRRVEAAQDATMAHESEGSSRSPFPNADDPVVAVAGTRPEYTPLKDHYKVFLNTEPTVIDGTDYVLPITGLVDNPLMLTLDDIRNNYESIDRYITLSCISGRIGTTLISTTQWTGVRMQDILADAQVRPEANYLYITSGDGFYETVDLDLIASDPRIMLCYAWDGNTLPVDHGFPLRIWLPDRFGMKQPKWITGLEFIDEYREGYWVERNWDEVAQVKTTSVIDTVAVDSVYEVLGQKFIPVGGISWGGDRQISMVEVRVNGGPWEEAHLRSPLSETTWVIWRYDWPYEAGEHHFQVRCAEGDGTPQIEEMNTPRPSGSTGIHSVIEDVPEA